MKIDLLRISFLPKDQRLPEPPSDTPASDKDYYAVTIEDGERCYYWAHGVTLEVTKEKLDRVRGNRLWPGWSRRRCITSAKPCRFQRCRRWRCFIPSCWTSRLATSHQRVRIWKCGRREPGTSLCVSIRDGDNCSCPRLMP